MPSSLHQGSGGGGKSNNRDGNKGRVPTYLRDSSIPSLHTWMAISRPARKRHKRTLWRNSLGPSNGQHEALDGPGKKRFSYAEWRKKIGCSFVMSPVVEVETGVFQWNRYVFEESGND